MTLGVRYHFQTHKNLIRNKKIITFFNTCPAFKLSTSLKAITGTKNLAMNHCQDFTKKNSKSMTQKLLLTFIAFFIMKFVAGQIVIVPIGIIAGAVMPEHGFLPGKKFKFYSTINKY